MASSSTSSGGNTVPVTGASATAGGSKEAQRRLMKRLNIVFEGPAESADQSRLPDQCQTIFRHVRLLGRTGYEQYRETVEADLVQKPWKEQARRRARRISELARVCVQGRKNEGGWRLSLESEIMARFTVEVACRNCRGRLWRSEQEASPNQQNVPSAAALKNRQLRRRPCSCGVSGADINEQGISPIFDDRVDEAFVYPTGLQAEMAKREERPDRVFGLRRTTILERLLLSTEDRRPSANGMLIGDSLKTSPFRPDGEPIVFPFLVIEAKSEKGVETLADTELQTAFAIRELLRIQDGLREAAEESAHWDAGPLVWFLSYKGAVWRVSVACIDRSKGRPCYRVFRVWSGSVDSVDAALQLLLIADYMVDWARDVYREAIIRSLASLAVNTSRSLVHDSDILSVTDRARLWSVGPDILPDFGPPEGHDPLRGFDSWHGAVRDANFIRSKFMSLYITEENFWVLIESAGSEVELKRLVTSILVALSEAWRVHREALDLIEFEWTGKTRNGSDLYPPDKVFLVSVTAVAYLTPNWEQTRELGYLAVAESLRESLFDIASMEPTPRRGFPYVDTSTFATLRTLLRNSPQENLSMSVSRACLVTGFSMTPEHYDLTTPAKDRYHRFASATALRLERAWQVDIVAKPVPLSQARELVYAFFEKHKVTTVEPSTIFRTSTRLDELHLPTARDGKQPETSPPNSHSLWPAMSGLPEMGDQKLILAASNEPGADSELCLFVMDASVLLSGMVPSRLREYCSNWHFSAKRFDRRPVWSHGWNLRDLVSPSTAIAKMVDKLFHHLRVTAEDKEPDGLPECDPDPKGKGKEVISTIQTEATTQNPTVEAGPSHTPQEHQSIAEMAPESHLGPSSRSLDRFDGSATKEGSELGKPAAARPEIKSNSSSESNREAAGPVEPPLTRGRKRRSILRQDTSESGTGSPSQKPVTLKPLPNRTVRRSPRKRSHPDDASKDDQQNRGADQPNEQGSPDETILSPASISTQEKASKVEVPRPQKRGRIDAKGPALDTALFRGASSSSNTTAQGQAASGWIESWAADYMDDEDLERWLERGRQNGLVSLPEAESASG